MQQMSENFVDTFGLSDGTFSDDTEDDSHEMRHLTNVLSEEDATSSASEAIKRAQGIFEAICEQRFTSFPGSFEDDPEKANEMKAEDHETIADEEEEEDPWADKTKEISFASPEKRPSSCTDRVSAEDNDQNSSDEEVSVEGDGAAEAKTEVKASETIVATIENNSKMEVDSDEDDDDAGMYKSKL